VRALRVLAVLAVVLLVGVVAGAYAAGKEPPTMTPGEAKVFAAEALAAAGLRNVAVQDDVREDTFVSEGTGEPVPVYVVPADVAGNRLELYVQRTGNRAVNLDDAMPDGGFLLNDEQFKQLEEFRFDPAAQRVAADRRGPATLAGVLALVVSGALVLSAVGRRRARAASSAEA
jgi:hypothetical protein